MNQQKWDDDEELPRTWWQRYGVLVIVGTLAVGGGGAAYKFMSGPKSAGRAENMTVVSLPPLPPPAPKPTPPPPPPPPQQKQEPEEKKMDEAKQEDVPEQKPDPEPPKADEPPPALGTGIKGDGAPDGFGLSGSGGWGGLGRGGGGSGSPGSVAGWYAGKVKKQVLSALQQNTKTNRAALSLQVRVSPDPTGSPRVTVVNTSGDPALVAEIKRVLANQRFDAPPAGMKLPITYAIKQERPR